MLLGPLTFLLLAKTTDDRLDPVELLPWLVPVYEDLLDRLGAAGADWVQLDEPALATDLADDCRVAYEHAYGALGERGPEVLLTTYFGGVVDEHPWLFDLPVDGIHLDLVRGPRPARAGARPAPARPGAVGRRRRRPQRLADRPARRPRRGSVRSPTASATGSWVAPSCSLLHVPYDVDAEPDLDPDVRPWLAFAQQKLRRGRHAGPGAHRRHRRRRRTSWRPATSRRLPAGGARSLAARPARSTGRGAAARPTTSGPPAYARAARGAGRRLGRCRRCRPRRSARSPRPPSCATPAATRAPARSTDAAVPGRSARPRSPTCIAEQEALGLDVLVHGEPERNDMVQYFGEQLDGFATTRHGWVQSYGSRYVRPPILYGDVARPEPMTVRWSTYAQSLTERPVKGMLTGPVTILKWSFVRDDQPRGRHLPPDRPRHPRRGRRPRGRRASA